MQSFETIWQRYERELSSFVLSRVHDIEIQKEIMQEVALKIFTSLHQQQTHLRGWVYQITKNTIVDYYRKANRTLPELEEIAEPEEHIMQECLSPMLNKLSHDQKALLELNYLKEYSVAEIAKQKNLPLNTVKSKLYRAKKSLSRAFFSCCTYEQNAQGNIVDFKVLHSC